MLPTRFKSKNTQHRILDLASAKQAQCKHVGQKWSNESRRVIQKLQETTTAILKESFFEAQANPKNVLFFEGR
jgi:hypothetical protein